MVRCRVPGNFIECNAAAYYGSVGRYSSIHIGRYPPPSRVGISAVMSMITQPDSDGCCSIISPYIKITYANILPPLSLSLILYTRILPDINLGNESPASFWQLQHFQIMLKRIHTRVVIFLDPAFCHPSVDNFSLLFSLLLTLCTLIPIPRRSLNDHEKMYGRTARIHSHSTRSIEFRSLFHFYNTVLQFLFLFRYSSL